MRVYGQGEPRNAGQLCNACGDESHADINTACVILKRGIECAVDWAEGQAAHRHRVTPHNRPTQWSAWPRKGDANAPRARRGYQKVTQIEIFA